MLEADTRVFVNRMLYHVMLNATINLIMISQMISWGPLGGIIIMRGPAGRPVL